MPIDDKTRKQINLALCTALQENPRVTVKELFRIIASLRNWKKLHGSAQQILDKPFEDRILVGPYLYCNSDMKVTLHEEKDVEKVNSMGFAISLVGNYSYLQVSRHGKGNLSYAELIKPSFPEKVTLEGGITDDERAWFDQWFATPKRLNPDIKPEWDDAEWELYGLMRNPRQNFFEVGKELRIPWEMVRERFQRIVKDCKVFVGFFPLGYSQYDHLLVTMRTEYEIGIREFLKGLDRSSWLFKVDDLLVLYLFHTHINLTCLKFGEMNCMGIIEDVRVGIPLDVDKERFLIV
ncbi:MAG: hypothetical protein AYK18_14670 [Theionarchaea archaeon DG-70]|nr:MAG: hypothetical protein AYK18_14670 [Theionarchaea archaeon DG-70]